MKNHRKTTHNRMPIFYTLILLSFLFVYGTVGAFEQDLISLSRFVIQSITGYAVMLVCGVVVND